LETVFRDVSGPWVADFCLDAVVLRRSRIWEADDLDLAGDFAGAFFCGVALLLGFDAGLLAVLRVVAVPDSFLRDAAFLADGLALGVLKDVFAPDVIPFRAAVVLLLVTAVLAFARALG
jgi:hypothetical protein